MKTLIMSYFAQKLEDRNMQLFFVKGCEQLDTNLTELGKQIVNTMTALAKANINEDRLTTTDGFNHRVNDYEIMADNIYKVVNFSDLVSMAESGKSARNYCAQSNCDLSFDPKYVVSPCTLKDNLVRLNSRFRKEAHGFQFKAIDKQDYLIRDFNVIYKGDGKYFADVKVDGSSKVPDEVVYLRKLSFKNKILASYYDEVRNVLSNEEYLIWTYNKNGEVKEK